MSGVMNIISASSQQITCPNYVIEGNTTLNGSVAIGGPITSLNNQSYAAEDDGLYQMNIGAGTFGSVPVSSTVVPFPGVNEGSLYFNGVSGNYLSFKNTAISGYAWGTTTTPMTVEAWVYYNSFSGSISSLSSLVGIIDPVGDTNYWSFGPTSTGILKMYYYGSPGGSVNTTVAISLNTWTHIAMTSDTSKNIRLFINGVVSAGPTAVAGVPAANSVVPFTIGQWNNAPTNAYISNLRIVTGAALYTAAFTPSTAPLTVANAGTTVFLLRVPQNPGKMLVSKIGGTTDVRAYPPVALTGYSTNLTGKTGYGGGTYVVSASTSATLIYHAFDKITSTYWQTPNNLYSTTTPFAYTGSVATVDTLGNSYAGEWIQIQLPVSIILTSFALTYFTNQFGTSTWFILGSNDGVRWNLLYQQTGTTWIGGPPAATQTFTVATYVGYTYFRHINKNCSGDNQINNGPALVEWTLYGTQESINITSDGKVGIGVVNPVQALEVAGSALFGAIAVSSITVNDNSGGTVAQTITTTKRFLVLDNSTTTSVVNLFNELSVPGNQRVILLEISAGIYGGGASGAGIFKGLWGGYVSPTAQSGTYTNVVNNLVNGTITFVNSQVGVFGITVTNPVAGLYKHCIIEWKVSHAIL